MSFSWTVRIDGSDIAPIVLDTASIEYGRQSLLDQPAVPVAVLELLTRDAVPSLAGRYPEFGLGDWATDLSGFTDAYAADYAGVTSRITLGVPVEIEAGTPSGFTDAYEDDYAAGVNFRRFTGRVQAIDYTPETIQLTCTTRSEAWARILVGATAAGETIPVETEGARAIRYAAEAGVDLVLDGPPHVQVAAVPELQQAQPLAQQLAELMQGTGGTMFTDRTGFVHIAPAARSDFLGSGGVVSTMTDADGEWVVHRFDSSGTFELSMGVPADVQLVGKGSVGGGGTGGNGGGGGPVDFQRYQLAAGSYAVVVDDSGSSMAGVHSVGAASGQLGGVPGGGDGGNRGGDNGAYASTPGKDGTTTPFGVFGGGGGGGAGWGVAGSPGGAGGGGYGDDDSSGSGGSPAHNATPNTGGGGGGCNGYTVNPGAGARGNVIIRYQQPVPPGNDVTQLPPGITLADPLSMSMDLGTVRNRVTVVYGPTPANGDRPTVTVQDDAQIAQFGLRDYKVDTPIQLEADARAYAAGVLALFDPVWTMPDAEVALHLADDRTTADVCALEQGDTVELPQLLSGSPDPSYTAKVLGYTERISTTDWRINLRLSPQLEIGYSNGV